MATTPNLLMWLTFATIVVTVVAYAWERYPLEVVAIGSLVWWLAIFWLVPALTATRSPLGPDDILAGFSNQALITVLALLVVGQGLYHTDALERPSAVLARFGGRSGTGSILLVLLAAMLTSAVVNDTPVVVMFMPIISAIAAARGIATPKVLMPLSFAALLGGMTTLIGTSTNLLVASVANKSAGIVIGFFTFTVPALAIVAPAFVYVALALPRMLKARGGMAEQMTGSTGKQFIAEIDVTYGHPLAGLSAVAGMFPILKDMTVRLIQRGEHAFLPPFENVTLQPGDSVIVAATRAVLARAIVDLSPTSREGQGATGDATESVVAARDLTLAEAVVAPGSRLIGRTVEMAGVHRSTETIVLGVERRRRMPRMPLGEIRLDAGDVLLLAGSREAVKGLRADRDLLLLEWSAADVPQRRYAKRALVIFASVVVYAASGIGPIVLGALAGALAMVLAGCLNIRQAARAFDRRIYLMIGSSLAAAAALEATGGARYLAMVAVEATAGRPVPVTLSAVFLVVAVLTNLVSNNAAAVLFTPIALGIAAQLGSDPMPFIGAVMIAASCAFATPIGYQTNMLVMGPGHYRFKDYLLAGGPLLVLMWMSFSIFMPWYYGL
jgi:di/tricarboxylate transporter